MTAAPTSLTYTTAHGWYQRADSATSARIGITAHAAEQLGDVIFVELPDVGASVSAGQIYGEVESTKSVSELYSPISGQVTAVNEAVVNDPTLINSDPYGAGWLLEVSVTEVPTDLLSAEQYLGTTA